MSARPDLAAIQARAAKRPRGAPARADIEAMATYIDTLDQEDRDRAVERLAGCPRCPGRWMAPAPYCQRRET